LVGAGSGIAPAAQRHHVGRAPAIGLACLDDVGFAGQVIVTVRHAPAALGQVDGIVVGILVVHADADIERAGGGDADRAHGAGDIVQGLQAGDIVQVLLHGLEAGGVDGGGVLEGVV